MVRLISIFVLIFISHQGASQFELSHRKLTLNDGLPSNTIFDIIQGSDGRMIIGHNLGLSSYNGIRFEEFESELKNAALSNLVEVYPQVYLCRNFNDEVFFTNGKELVKIDLLSTKKTGFSTFFHYNGSIYCKKFNVISKITYTQKLNQETIISLEENVNVTTLCTTKDKIYLSQNEKIICFNGVNSEGLSELKIPNDQIKFLLTKNDQPYIYVSLKSTLYQIGQSQLTDSIHFNQLDPSSKVNVAQFLKNGYLAIGTFSGLFLYDENFNFIGRYFKDSQISCIYEDLENNYWIGTLQDGVFIVPSLNIKTLNSIELFKEKTNIYSSITIHDSILVVGTYNGKIGVIDKRGKVARSIDLEQVAEVQCMYYNALTNELLAYCGKLFVVDFDSFKLKQIIECPSTKSILQINNNIYCGTSTGLQLISPELKTGYQHELWIKKLTPFRDKIILETTTDLLCFDPLTSAIEPYEPLQSFSDSAQILNTVVHNDTLYFTYRNSAYFMVNDSIVKLFETPKSITGFVLIGDRIFTTDGSIIYLFDGLTLRIIDRYKGLQIAEIKSLHNLNGELLILNNTTIQYFEKFLPKNEVQPTLILKTVKGTFAKKEHFWESEYDQNELNIDFEILPNISAIGSAKVLYQLSGQISQLGTVDINQNKTLLFQRLPAGEYELKLSAINEFGVKSETLNFTFIVLQPYYLSWWFISFVILTLMALIFFLVKWRILIQTKKNQEKTQKERLKIKALNAELNAIRAQMNPHFIFNCLSSIQVKILDDDSRNAYESLTVFTRLLREALLFTTKEFISLAEEISFIQKYVHLEQMRREGAFEFKLTIEEELDLNRIKFPSLISQPIIENAILHGLMHQDGPKTLKFDVFKSQDSNRIKVIIEDNGIGIVNSREKNLMNRKNHVSFGSKAIIERVELLQKQNFNVEIETVELVKGTKVIISIPIQVYE